MSLSSEPSRLNLLALAQSGQTLTGRTPLTDLARLAADVPVEAVADEPVVWQAQAELRPRLGGEDQLWLHLSAQARVPLACQRCLAPADQDLEVDQWFRFVESEAAAEAEDDDSEEDLLVMEPQFDLLALIEDELIMTLPLVPMHEQCPEPPVLQTDDVPEPEKPHPFAALAQLKKPRD